MHASRGMPTAGALRHVPESIMPSAQSQSLPPGAGIPAPVPAGQGLAGCEPGGRRMAAGRSDSQRRRAGGPLRRVAGNRAQGNRRAGRRQSGRAAPGQGHLRRHAHRGKSLDVPLPADPAQRRSGRIPGKPDHRCQAGQGVGARSRRQLEIRSAARSSCCAGCWNSPASQSCSMRSSCPQPCSAA